MSIAHETPPDVSMPSHLDLPFKDDKPVDNLHQPAQRMLLTGVLTPVLDRLRPNGDYVIGSDSGIYFRWDRTDPISGCRAPDWFCILGVPRLLNGEMRRSYVLWKEKVPPLVVIELISGNGYEERDTTPDTGKFWIYEHSIQAKYYVIHDPFQATLDVYFLKNKRYRPLPESDRGRVAIPELGIEFGNWKGNYGGYRATWLRAWNRRGHLIRTPEERAEAEMQRAEAEMQRAEAEMQRAEAEMQRAEAEMQRAEAEMQRAENEKHRADKLAAKLRELGVDPSAL